MVDRPTLFIAVFAPFMLFLSGVFAMRQEWWDALFAGCLGLACYLAIIADLKRALAATHPETP